MRAIVHVLACLCIPLVWTRQNRPRRFPGRRDENWWLVVGETSANSLLAIKRVKLGAAWKGRLDFTAPSAGAHTITVYLMCDSYMGADQVPPPPSPVPHASMWVIPSYNCTSSSLGSVVPSIRRMSPDNKFLRNTGQIPCLCASTAISIHRKGLPATMSQ